MKKLNAKKENDRIVCVNEEIYSKVMTSKILSVSEKLLWVWFSVAVSYPYDVSISKIAEGTQLTEEEVEAGIEHLEKLGFFEVDENGEGIFYQKPKNENF